VQVRNMVDAGALNDLKAASAFELYALPKCVAAPRRAPVHARALHRAPRVRAAPGFSCVRALHRFCCARGGTATLLRAHY
jgi:hypothetical protein